MFNFLLTCFFFIRIFRADNYILESLTIIYRHGDRSPVWVYPNDRYDKTYWSNGLGQLTKVGIQQEYILGTLIKNRYTNNSQFLNTSYKSEEIIIRSTDVDRTLMSAQSVLTGLYPPNNSYEEQQVWKPDLNWQPIPVHTIPLNSDYLLNAGAACPLFKTMEEQIWTKDDIAIDDLFNFLQNESGVVPFNLKSLDILVDPMICEISHNLTQPKWLNQTTVDLLLELHNLRFKLNYKYPKMQTLSAGALIHEIVDIMDIKIKEIEGHNISEKKYTKYKHKLHMYSGHDTTLTALLSILNAFTLNSVIKSPYYSAAIFFEFYSKNRSNEYLSSHRKERDLFNTIDGSYENVKDNKKNYFVKIFYKNSPLKYFENLTNSSEREARNENQIEIMKPSYGETDDNMVLLKLPGCLDEYCPFETFVSYVSKRFPTDIEKECQQMFILSYCHSTRNNWATCFIVFPIFLLMCILLCSWGLIVWAIKRPIIQSGSNSDLDPLNSLIVDNGQDISENTGLINDKNRDSIFKIPGITNISNPSNYSQGSKSGYTAVPTSEY
ncbi:prostatic acid phosphatase-like isoform X2 [Gordionus sp. m RMFG-2023]|uniref:prostatic acid phosphatase-like isoform X2 n=1 Tax=Gordionus sp. m RMFG-2023 TaxID=3053472 RepID=UPI0031FC86E5